MSAVALVIVGLGGFVALSATGPSADSEAQVKAGYLYKLASFVRWPADTFADGQAPLRICIAGRDDIFMATRALVHGRQAAGHPLRTERIDPAHPETAARCQILFIGQEGPAARRPIAQAGDRPVLTVTDRSAGVHGGIIEFVRAGDNVRFAIHRKAAEARQLELSSKLLAVAELIEP
ncbi:MAG: YfiR family protein, partial [Novosphingobium sp.]|jgi:hypothetical protein|nr:YfiR family protein [Novosphingobium sp.]